MSTCCLDNKSCCTVVFLTSQIVLMSSSFSEVLRRDSISNDVVVFISSTIALVLTEVIPRLLLTANVVSVSFLATHLHIDWKPLSVMSQLEISSVFNVLLLLNTLDKKITSSSVIGTLYRNNPSNEMLGCVRASITCLILPVGKEEDLNNSFFTLITFFDNTDMQILSSKVFSIESSLTIN